MEAGANWKKGEGSRTSQKATKDYRKKPQVAEKNRVKNADFKDLKKKKMITLCPRQRII